MAGATFQILSKNVCKWPLYYQRHLACVTKQSDFTSSCSKFIQSSIKSKTTTVVDGVLTRVPVPVEFLPELRQTNACRASLIGKLMAIGTLAVRFYKIPMPICEDSLRASLPRARL